MRRELNDLDGRILLEFVTGRQPPQMPLVHGALADIGLNRADSSIVQHLVP